ncbi:MAG: VanZ family protein [Coriobacteriales bacterium]|nr:VanZ family protein [Coriobacteriales bacterium]
MAYLRSLVYTGDPRRYALLVLVILIPGVVLGVCSSWFDRHRTLRRALGLVALAVYVRYVLHTTVFARVSGGVVSVRLVPFWSYRECLEWTDTGLRVVAPDILEQIVLNYALYLPLGYLLAFALPEAFGDGSVAGGTVCVGLVAATVSLSCEVAQLLMQSGWAEYDDVFGNTVGAVLGYLFYCMARAASSRRVLDRER